MKRQLVFKKGNSKVSYQLMPKDTLMPTFPLVFKKATRKLAIN